MSSQSPSTGSAPSTILAADFLRPGVSAIEAATNTAAAVIARCALHDLVQVSFAGVGGVSSSYFNQLLLDLRDQVGIDRARVHVRYIVDSDAQRFVFDKSYQAVFGSPAVPPPSKIG